MTWIESYISRLGLQVILTVRKLGVFSEFSFKTFFWVLKPPYRFNLLTEQLYFIGNKSIFIVLLTGSFTGMVMAYQTYFGFKMINADTFVGPITALALAKELAPVLTGLIVTGRAGAAIAAPI